MGIPIIHISPFRCEGEKAKNNGNLTEIGGKKAGVSEGDLMVLTELEIKEIALKKDIRYPELFVMFIKERFPKQGDASYIAEWADRFKSGDPTVQMDSESLRAYIKSVKKLNRVV